jgi:hypothetical protein
LDVLVAAACATRTAVGFAPLTTSCQYTLMCVVFSPAAAAERRRAGRRTRRSTEEEEAMAS